MDMFTRNQKEEILLLCGKVVDKAVDDGKKNGMLPKEFIIDSKAKDILSRIISMNAVSNDADLDSTRAQVESFILGYAAALDMLPKYETIF